MIPANTKAIIFDMDGLLIDSEPYWNKADEAFLEKYGISFTPEIIKKTLGMGQKEVMEYYQNGLGLEGDPQELIEERKELLYRFLLPDLQLMEGAEQLIERCFDDDYWLAIATAGHTQEKIKEILTKTNLQNYFPVLVSYEDVERGKPFPDIYLKAAEKLRLDPDKCLVLEDAPNGVKAGKEAGMNVFGINKDLKLQQALQEAGADQVISSLSEIVI